MVHDLADTDSGTFLREFQFKGGHFFFLEEGVQALYPGEGCLRFNFIFGMFRICLYVKSKISRGGGLDLIDPSPPLYPAKCHLDLTTKFFTSSGYYSSAHIFTSSFKFNVYKTKLIHRKSIYILLSVRGDESSAQISSQNLMQNMEKLYFSSIFYSN